MMIGRKCFRRSFLLVCTLLLIFLFGCGQVVDGPDMERKEWMEFTISQTSDEYEQNFSYTVKYDQDTENWYLCMEVPHETKGYPIEKREVLKSDTIRDLYNLNILSFKDKKKQSSEDDVQILDGTFLKFSVIDVNGTEYEKELSSEAEQEIITLISPYVNKIKGLR